MNSQADVETLRAVSKKAFGHTHRLELMLAILNIEDGICTLSDLASSLGVTMSSLQRPFESLIALNLLAPLPGGDTKFRYFIRTGGAGWHWAAELGEVTHASGGQPPETSAYEEASSVEPHLKPRRPSKTA